MTATTPTTLGVADVIRMAAAIDLAAHGSVIRFLDADDSIRRGTVRHLTDADGSGMYPRANTDARDCWVRITLDTGLDRWLALPVLGDMLATGYAAPDGDR